MGTRNILKIRDTTKVTEDIFDMRNVRFFKEIEKKKMGDVHTLLCLRSAELSKVFGLRNLCYSKISVVMLLGAKTRVRGKKVCPAPKCCIFKKLVSYMPGAKNLKQ